MKAGLKPELTVRLADAHGYVS